MNSILSKAQLGTQPGGRPPAAVEITPEGVLAASIAAPGQDTVYAFVPLAPGALVPGIADTNLLASEAVAAAIRSALDQVSPRSRSVTAVIPDTVVRVFVLDFDVLPSKPAEAYSVLRFRLRKMVPFDVEHAGLSYQVLVEKKDETKVLAAVLPGPVLAEYETAVRAAGYEPGAVLSSSLAALAGVDSLQAVLVANISPLALTTSISNGQDLLLYRTLDLPENPVVRLEEVRRGVAVAAAYYEDKLGTPPAQLYFAGNTGSHENGSEAFARWIDFPDLAVLDLNTRPATGELASVGSASIAGVTGALTGVR